MAERPDRAAPESGRFLAFLIHVDGVSSRRRETGAAVTPSAASNVRYGCGIEESKPGLDSAFDGSETRDS